jgi:hypothetical protein
LAGIRRNNFGLKYLCKFNSDAVLPTAVGPATTINFLLLFSKPGKIVKKLSAYSLAPTACAWWNMPVFVMDDFLKILALHKEPKTPNFSYLSPVNY